MPFINDFQEKIWRDKYQYGDETYEGFCERLAYTIFSDDKVKGEKLKASIMDFRTLFGGRINSNIGTPEGGLTLFNCFIEPISEEPDSLEGIMEMATNYALTLKTEGGVGFCANFFRPANTIIRKIGVTSPGAVAFLEIFNTVSSVITSGSVNKEDSFQGIPTKKSIRKGATMVTMSANHPDIFEFITAKALPNKLTKMNMSVLVTDAFMYAVDNDLNWDLWFPNINCEEYDKEWDGNFEKWAEKGYATIVYKTIKAMELWELLLKNSYLRNEPGILFIDTIRRMDNINYLESSVCATNPCAEVSGNTGKITHKGKEYNLGDVCDLGSLSLTKYYDMELEVFDKELFVSDVELMVEALDNIIEISKYPLDMYEYGAKMKRKIGLGICGLGSLFMMMGVRYGSEYSVKFTEDLLKLMMNTAYRTSALLAKEKGPFELYSDELIDTGYVKYGGILDKDVLDLIGKYGLRNCALSAIAPTGSLAILAGNVSGGLEPVFMKEFVRWNRVEGKKVDFKYPNVHKGEWFETDYLKEEKIADEVVLMSTDNHYRIDKNQGLCEEVTISDYGYTVGKAHGKTEFTTTNKLEVQDHLNILSVFAKYIDLSASKTINLPADISFEEFKTLYGRIHDYGVKGCTTYRDGTSVAVLEAKREEKIQSIKEQHEEFLEAFKGHENGDIFYDVVKLPEEYPSRGYIVRAEKSKWYLQVAFKNREMTKPFAIFVNTNNPSPTPITMDAIDQLKILAESVGLGGEKLAEVEHKFVNQKNPVKIARMLGFMLRHNISVVSIVKALDKVDGAHPGTFVFRIKKFLCQFIIAPTTGLDMVCQECGGKNIVLQEGCIKCLDCDYSKCE